MSDDFSQINPELVKKAYEMEVDPHLKSQLASLNAMVSYSTADFSTKRELLKILGNSSLLGAQNFLASLIKKDESGNYVEKDKNLHPVIEMAFNEFKSRRFRAEVVSNIFTGLSLGSILLLAALGLAITYGLIGVINMAHGEFLMIGAYTTFVVQTIFRSFFMQYLSLIHISEPTRPY